MIMRLKFALGLVALFLSTASWAQLSPALDRFQMSVGGFDGHTDTTFRAILRTPGGTINRVANLEGNGQMKAHQTVMRYQVSGVIGDHQGFGLDYYSLVQTRNAQGPTFALPIRGRSIAVSDASRLRAQFDLGTASYRYWFGNGPNVLGVGVGVAYYHINLKIDGPNAANSVGYAHGKFAPSLSLAYIHAFNDRWKFYARAQGIAKNTGSSQGHIYHGSIGVSYAFANHWAAGIEYGVAHLQIQESRGPYTGMVDLNVRGPGAYVSFRW